ncbi:sodium channel protein Nach-like [Prorops nasuta]|uniref:sodium channel protein Nach-like n=1 Tax=Prorops nasuta TaxID=863751 RepID=UPI0034CF527B
MPAYLRKFWQTLTEVYKEFAMESTIHGIKYTTNAKSAIARFLWLVVMILSLSAAGILAHKFYDKHRSASMSTLVISDQFPTEKLLLPAVTLCHGSIAVVQKVLAFFNSQKRIYIPRGLTREDFEIALRYLREVIYPTNHFQEELDKLQQILTANRISLLELLDSVSLNCSDFVVMCRFEGKAMPCSMLLEPIVTQYGICCAFNYVNPDGLLQKSEGVVKFNYSRGFGALYVLSFLMKSVPSSEIISSLIYGNGIKVILHERYTYPGPTAMEFVAADGFETVARLYGTYLISSPEVLNLPSRVRGCYKSISGSLPFRAENCYFDCRESITKKLCSCLPFFSTTTEGDVQVCNLTHISCLARIASELDSLTLQDPRCNCLPSCEETTYAVTLTKVPLQDLKHRPGDLYTKAQEYKHVTILHLTFAGQSALLERTELVLSNINLVSSLGGVFSLFLGFSFISIIEVIYFFCIDLVIKFKQKLSI